MEVPRVQYEKLASESVAKHQIRLERVESARKIQRERFKNFGFATNSEMRLKDIKLFCRLDEKCQELLKPRFINIIFRPQLPPSLNSPALLLIFQHRKILRRSY